MSTLIEKWSSSSDYSFGKHYELINGLIRLNKQVNSWTCENDTKHEENSTLYKMIIVVGYFFSNVRSVSSISALCYLKEN